MNKAYEQEIEMWNQVFKECTPVDLRKLDLKVETMFDEALIQFANEKAKLSEYKTATFLEGGEHMISQMEENSFDGTEGRY